VLTDSSVVPKSVLSEMKMRKRTQDRGKSNCKFPSTFMDALLILWNTARVRRCFPTQMKRCHDFQHWDFLYYYYSTTHVSYCNNEDEGKLRRKIGTNTSTAPPIFKSCGSTLGLLLTSAFIGRTFVGELCLSAIGNKNTARRDTDLGL
jgi:hypothetical protein